VEFGLSEEQRLLQASLSGYLNEHASLDRVRRFADNTTDKANKTEARARDIEQGLAELGVPALMIDEAHGGVGLGTLDACVVAEALGYSVTPAPFVANAVIAPLALRLAGSEAQRREWLPKLASGELVIGAALAESAGARVGAGVTASRGKLTGKSLFVLDFEADVYLVGDVAGGLTLVSKDASGLTRRRLETVDRTRPIGELVFDKTNAEPLPGASRTIVRTLLDHGRVMLAADTLGAAQAMLDKAVAYAKEREQFGRAIASFQAVKHMCAEMAAQLEPTRAFAWYAAHALDETSQDAHLTACHLKAHVSEVGGFVAKTATEVHGGMGFTDLLGLHYWFKRIGFNRQMLGSPERLREEAARQFQ